MQSVLKSATYFLYVGHIIFIILNIVKVVVVFIYSFIADIFFTDAFIVSTNYIEMLFFCTDFIALFIYAFNYKETKFFDDNCSHLKLHVQLI